MEHKLYSELIAFADEHTDINWYRAYQDSPAPENEIYGTVYILELEETLAITQQRVGLDAQFATMGQGLATVDWNTYNRLPDGTYPSKELIKLRHFWQLREEALLDELAEPCVGISVHSIGNIHNSSEIRKSKFQPRSTFRQRLHWVDIPDVADMNTIEVVDGFEIDPLCPHTPLI